MPIDPKKQLESLKKRCVEIIPEEELYKKLDKSAQTKKPLKIKLGCDPSKPDLHIGHAVVIHKLREFQDFGHEAILVVGDFTGMIGDPSGRSKTRPQLTQEETKKNGQTYFEQASKILDPKKTRIVYNSEWLAKMSFADVVRLAGTFTVARMLERDDFKKRFGDEEPISVHEFLYPLAQAMDSVALEADVELGGTDQKFNLLVGREVQREYGQEPQVIMTMPILEGTDGVQKMSKSLDNYVGLTDEPADMFGKIMSIPDTLILKYFELAAFAEKEELARVENALDDNSINPMALKKELARRIIAMYHNEKAANEAQAAFERVFSRKEIPEDIETTKLTRGSEIWIVDLLRDNKLVASGGEARRLIEQGGVQIDGEKVLSHEMKIVIEKQLVIKVGKRRFLRIEPK